MVRAKGLEPPHLTILVPKTSASTNSATPAAGFRPKFEPWPLIAMGQKGKGMDSQWLQNLKKVEGGFTRSHEEENKTQREINLAEGVIINQLLLHGMTSEIDGRGCPKHCTLVSSLASSWLRVNPIFSAFLISNPQSAPLDNPAPPRA